MSITTYFIPQVNLGGAGSVTETGNRIKTLGAKKALTVTDAGMVNLGIADRIKEIVEKADVKAVIFGGSEPNPTDLNQCFPWICSCDGNLPHGVCNAILLPHICEFNVIGNDERFKDIAVAMGENIEGLSTFEAANVAIASIKKLSAIIGIPSGLKELGVKEEDFEIMAKNAKADACQLTNPRLATLQQVMDIFGNAM